MLNKTKIFAVTLIMGALATVHVAEAADVSIHASLKARLALSATAGNDMNFGTVNFDRAHNGRIQIGTDGRVSLGAGSAGLNVTGENTTPADVMISGDSQSTVSIACDASGRLSNGAGGALGLTNVEFSVDSGKSYGSATACRGLGEPSETLDLGANNTPKLYFGGAVDVQPNSFLQNADYSTANGGGDPIRVRLIYQ